MYHAPEFTADTNIIVDTEAAEASGGALPFSAFELLPEPAPKSRSFVRQGRLVDSINDSRRRLCSGAAVNYTLLVITEAPQP